MKQLFILFFLCFAFQSSACINLYQTLINGEIVEDGMQDFVHHHQHHNDEYSKERLEYNKAFYWEMYESTKSHEDLSDYAATLTYLGEYQKAKNIYHQIEKTHPNLYTTASNLGTIYELIGKVDSAYYWINKSITINPDSHDGSEWIHLKILAFKQSNNQDYSKSILDFDFGDGEKPKLKNDSLRVWTYQLEHQLIERTIFVKPTNKIVGNLYFDYGNLLAITTNLETAIEAYEAAIEYGYENEVMRKRLSHFKKMVRKADLYNEKKYNNHYTESEIIQSSNFNPFYIIGAVIFLAIGFLYWKFTN